MSEVDIDGATVGEILRALAERYPDTGDQLLSGEGELNRYVNVYVNDEDVRVQNGLETEVGQADTVVILPAMAGGLAAHISLLSASQRGLISFVVELVGL